jgi:DNA-binding NtrC family response regulator
MDEAESETPEGFQVQLPEEGVALEEIEKDIILKAYEQCGRNKSKTARFLRMPRHILIYRLKKLGVEKG